MLEQIIGYVNIGLWALFGLSLLLAFLRGFKRSISRLIATIISIILAFVFTNLLAKSMCTFNFGALFGQGNMSLSSIIEDLIKESFGINQIANDSALKDFCTAASMAIVKIPIYICMYTFLILILRPLIAIIVRTLLPLPTIKKFWMRFIGVGINVITFFLVVWFWVFILLGAKGLVQEVIVSFNQVTDSQQQVLVSEEENMLKEIEHGLEVFDNSSFIKVLTVFSGDNNKLESKLLGNMITIKTQNGNLNFVAEIENVLSLVNVFTNLDGENEEELIQYLINNKDQIINALKNSEILNVVLPIGIEVIDYTIEEIDVSNLVDVDWKKEKIHLLDSLNELLNGIIELDIDFEDPLAILNNPEFPNILAKIGKNLNESELIRKVVIVYANDFLQEELKKEIGEEYPDLLNVLDLTKINLENDLLIVGNVLVEINKLGILNGGEFDIINNGSAVSYVLKNAFNLSTVKGNESAILEAILGLTGMNETLADMGIELNLNVSDWSYEINNLANVIESLLTLLKENGVTNLEDLDILKILSESTGSKTLDDIIDSICSCNIINGSLINIIDKMLTDNDLSGIKSEKFNQIVEGTIDLDVDEFKNEFKLLLECLVTILEITDSEEEVDISVVQTALMKLCDSTYISIQFVMEYICDEFLGVISDTFEKKLIVENHTNVEWKLEIEKMFNVIDAIQNNGFLDEDFGSDLSNLDVDAIIDTLKKLNESDTLRVILPDIFKLVIPEENILSDWLLQQCGIDEEGNNKPVQSFEIWNEEIERIKEAVTVAKNHDFMNIDMNNLKDEDYEAIEETALALNNSMVINCDFLTDKIQSVLENSNINVELAGVFDRNSSNSNKDEWTLEIPKLVDIIKSFNELETIDETTLQSNPVGLGKLLEQLKDSYLFGNDTRCDADITVDDNEFNALIIEVLGNTNLIKSIDNPTGFIDENDALTADWASYNWESELTVLASFDSSKDVQEDTTIQALSTSQIIRDYFDLATILNDKLDGKQIHISKSGASITLVLSEYVNGGEPFENEELRSKNWTEEIDGMNALTSLFEAGYNDNFKSNLEEIISENEGTYAAETALAIKTKLTNETYLGVSIWDII